MRTYVWQLIFVLMSTTPLAAQSQNLSLGAAIQAALDNNASVEISEEQAVQAALKADEQRARLLPNVNGSAGYTNQTINLGARGFQFPGIPLRVGPFGIADGQVEFFGPVLDFSLIRRYQASRRAADSSEFDTQGVRNKVAAMVAALYYGVQRSRAMEESIRAQIQLDESLLKLARDRQEVGVGTGLDVTRADSRLVTDQYRLIESQNASRSAELKLLRAMGDRLDKTVDLTDPLTAASLTTVGTITEAIAIAMSNRPEMKAEAKRVDAARLTSGAASAERLPSVHALANYGGAGNFDRFVPSYLLGVQLIVPIFDGGRRTAHQKTAESQLRQAEVRAKDVRDEIELEVRVAEDNLASAREQLRAAEQSLRLAQEELDIARLRFEGQVTTQIDVINAQAELSAARTRQVNAQFALKSAEVEYQRATGMDIR